VRSASSGGRSRACGPECGTACAAAASASTVVGEVAGGLALVALVRDADQRVTAYTCGVGAKAAARTGWFFGTGTGDPDAIPTLTSADGLVLAGRFDRGIARGTLTLPDGQVLPWEGKPTRAGAAPGLYERRRSLSRDSS
jgi:hypothetical protein